MKDESCDCTKCKVARGDPLFKPRRGDEVAEWLKRKRDEVPQPIYRGATSLVRVAIDELLDDYRLHADTGIPLSETVHEGEDFEIRELRFVEYDGYSVRGMV